jgi:hypothetical protein
LASSEARAQENPQTVHCRGPKATRSSSHAREYADQCAGEVVGKTHEICRKPGPVGPERKSSKAFRLTRHTKAQIDRRNELRKVLVSIRTRAEAGNTATAASLKALEKAYDELRRETKQLVRADKRSSANSKNAHKVEPLHESNKEHAIWSKARIVQDARCRSAT